jgi:sec-independent protein translocase protein TatA
MLRGIGPVEIGLILVIVLIVFGVGKIPQIGAGLGKGIREFKKASRGDYDEVSPSPEKKAEEVKPG